MNQEAFWERQYEQNIDRMVGVCYRYVADLPLAEDLAHDAFLKAIEKSDTYHATGKFDNWLMKIAVNETLMYLRHCPEMVEADETLTADEELPDESPLAALDFTQEELLSTIHELPLRPRTVFNLYALEHYPHAKIAENMGISVANSKVLLSRARQQLQQMLLAKAKEKEKRRKGLLMLLLLFAKGRPKAQSLDSCYENGLSNLKCAPANKLPEDKLKAAVAASPGGTGIAIAAHKTAIGVGAAACLAGIACFTYFALHEPVQPAVPTPTATAPSANTATSFDSTTDEGTRSTVVPIIADNHLAQTAIEEEANGSPSTTPSTSEAAATGSEPIVVTKYVPVKKTIVIKDTITRRDTVWVP